MASPDPESTMASSSAQSEEKRFAFGKNWRSFLRLLSEERIVEAEKSLRAMLETESLSGRSFLDVGCGSGLFSLAARRLDAAKVHSFDFDPQSVACARELKQRYFPQDERWTIETGSVLDAGYLARLGSFDVVYAWGVLHHTGRMWNALEAVIPLVAQNGRLFLAIYNDQAWISRLWKGVKKLYNAGWLGRTTVIAVWVPYFVGRGLVADLLRLRNPLARYRAHQRSRGMSVVHDWLDWLGGYPFEVAKPEQIFDFYARRGFQLLRLKTCGGTLGNNEFVLKRCAE
jgi:2-polyprenyl-3-methyl-5-hydroxy-6-metoxy-1,4-benzoquinol methylase